MSSRKETLRHKAAIAEFVKDHEGVQMRYLIELIHIGPRRTNEIVRQMLNVGTIYKTGKTVTCRYWSSEEAAKNGRDTNRVMADSEIESRRRLGETNAERREMPGMVFLCNRRPKSINTVFEQCKKNNEQTLMVYRVMAGVK